MANDTVYGLAAYFHTRDYAPAAARRREARVRHRRRQRRHHLAANAPFGGVKESGYGREGGSVGIDEYLDVKYVSSAASGSSDVRAMRQLVYGEPLVLQNVPEPVPGPGRGRHRDHAGRRSTRSTCGYPAARSPRPARCRGPAGCEGAGVTEEGRRVAFRGAGIGVTRDGSSPSASRCRRPGSPTCRTAVTTAGRRRRRRRRDGARHRRAGAASRRA